MLIFDLEYLRGYFQRIFEHILTNVRWFQEIKPN